MVPTQHSTQRLLTPREELRDVKRKLEHIKDLYEKNQTKLDIYASLLYGYKNIEALLGTTVTSRKGDFSKKNDGSYIMIPFDPIRFYHMMHTVVKECFGGKLYTLYTYNERIKFVDVGAGLGFKVDIASRLGFHSFGIEYDKDYVDFAEKYLRITLKHADALKENYSEYDVIYFYRPFSNNEKQAELEDKIYKTAKRGAIILPMSANYGPNGCMIDKLEKISREADIYRKK